MREGGGARVQRRRPMQRQLQHDRHVSHGVTAQAGLRPRDVLVTVGLFPVRRGVPTRAGQDVDHETDRQSTGQGHLPHQQADANQEMEQR